jgi:hypothetical protein
MTSPTIRSHQLNSAFTRREYREPAPGRGCAARPYTPHR